MEVDLTKVKATADNVRFIFKQMGLIIKDILPLSDLAIAKGTEIKTILPELKTYIANLEVYMAEFDNLKKYIKQ